MRAQKTLKEQLLFELKNMLISLAGAIVYAASITFFLDDNNIAPGGISGISIVISHFAPLNTGLLILLFNIPILILGHFKLGRRYVIYTLFCIFVSSGLVDAFELFERWFRVPITDDLLLAALAGGALMGIGIGLMMHAGGSSGGTDIIIRVLRIRNKHIKTGALYFCMDSAIILASALVFKNVDVALYAVLALVTNSVVLDMVLYGRDEAKVLIIISDKHEEISRRLLMELETGATYLTGNGAYTGDGKKVLICALHKSTFTAAREIVRDVDKDCFMIVSSASEIFGLGYKKHTEDEL